MKPKHSSVAQNNDITKHRQTSVTRNHCTANHHLASAIQNDSFINHQQSSAIQNDSIMNQHSSVAQNNDITKHRQTSVTRNHCTANHHLASAIQNDSIMNQQSSVTQNSDITKHRQTSVTRNHCTANHHLASAIQNDNLMNHQQSSVAQNSDITKHQQAVVRKIGVEELFSHDNCSCLHDEYMHECALAELPACEEKIASYRALEASGSDVFSLYGAFVEEKLIGFLILLTPVIPHYGRAMAVAESLFVASAYRSSGAGLLLIRQAEQRAKEVGSHGILFSSPNGGRLSLLLPRLGYRETNRVFFKESLHE